MMSRIVFTTSAVSAYNTQSMGKLLLQETEQAKCTHPVVSVGTFHWDIRRSTSGQLLTGAQWNAFWRLMGHPPAAEKHRAPKLRCVVGASDTIMFINGYRSRR